MAAKLLTLWVAILSITASKALATDADVTVYATTRAVVSLDVILNLFLPRIDFTIPNSGLIKIGTDASLDISTTSGIANSGGGGDTAYVSISGDATSTVNISCDSNATLSDGAGHNLIFTNIEITIDTPGPLGSGSPCAGLGVTALTADLSIYPTPVMIIGGAIDLTASPITVGATFSTTNVGGDPLSVRVTYQ